ncbi:MAG TPA: c-type cytochrome [Flavisolibacter sp.]|nr:c-type cytochrome [Flavisolibacter sp.]
MSIQKLILPLIFVAGASFTMVTQNDPWPVPEKYNKMANPVKADADALATGKTLWTKHCQSCHGKSGKGDGPKAAQLKTVPDDLSKADVQKQTDGAFFYKTSEGRDDMPSFKKKIPDQEEIWSIVNYMRTFKK